MVNDLQQLYGNIDIYLFDQLLKGRFDHVKKVLDVGCGAGRNLVYFLRNGFDVYGIDLNATAIETVQSLSKGLAPNNPVANFVVAKAEELPFEDTFFDLAVCSALLHFARNPIHFDQMLRSIWRVIQPGGYLFARMASNIGIETLVSDLGNGQHLLPDGSERFLVNDQHLMNYTHELKGLLFEPIKTTNVQNLRCMTTWCVQKQ